MLNIPSISNQINHAILCMFHDFKELHLLIGDNQLQMDLSEIAKGVYMVILQNGEGTLKKKIVVQ